MDTIAQRLAMFERALSTEELAAIWGMRPYTIREWIKSHRLPACKMGNEWKIDPADAIKVWERHRSGK
jgi:excisionase family DNA binding protein